MCNCVATYVTSIFNKYNVYIKECHNIKFSMLYVRMSWRIMSRHVIRMSRHKLYIFSFTTLHTYNQCN